MDNWTIEYIDGEYFNISIHNPLSGSMCTELPNELKNSKKGLINIENNDNKCFLWCHVRHLNPLNKNSQRITKVDKKIIIDNKDIKFPVSKKDYKKTEQKNNICISIFCYEKGLTYPVHISKQTFTDYMGLLLINDENKSHYIYIKDFSKFIFNKTKHKNKIHFCRYCLQCFSSGRILVEHKETCLKINGQQTVK